MNQVISETRLWSKCQRLSSWHQILEYVSPLLIRSGTKWFHRIHHKWQLLVMASASTSVDINVSGYESALSLID